MASPFGADTMKSPPEVGLHRRKPAAWCALAGRVPTVGAGRARGNCFFCSLFHVDGGRRAVQQTNQALNRSEKADKTVAQAKAAEIFHMKRLIWTTCQVVRRRLAGKKEKQAE